MQRSGHQIASHTWSHRSVEEVLRTDPAARDRNTELVYNEMALRNVLGVFPAYFRPPYLDCAAACVAQLAAKGYHNIGTNVDTKDYENDDPARIAVSRARFADGVAPDPAAQGYVARGEKTTALSPSPLSGPGRGTLSPRERNRWQPTQPTENADVARRSCASSHPPTPPLPCLTRGAENHALPCQLDGWPAVCSPACEPCFWPDARSEGGERACTMCVCALDRLAGGPWDSTTLRHGDAAIPYTSSCPACGTCGRKPQP